MTELRVLDLGAGNGMFGEQLHAVGVARVIGIDICEEAYIACERDRPGIYDAYYVHDFSDPDPITQKNWLHGSLIVYLVLPRLDLVISQQKPLPMHSIWSPHQDGLPSTLRSHSYVRVIFRASPA